MMARLVRPSWMAGYSLETALRLDRYVALLRKWNPVINLVAKATLSDVWTRHILDSVQVVDLCGQGCRRWADLGSGAGFPGLVVAFLAAERFPSMHVVLVESDRRKAEFLRNVSRETGVGVTVFDSRIETVPSLQADVVSARALAPLPILCSYAAQHLAPGGKAIFLKGARADREVDAAGVDWRFELQTLPSITDPAASVLVLTELRHV